MDFRTELAKWGYNRGNSIDVETLINEILPSLSSKQNKNLYSEEDLLKFGAFVRIEDKKEKRLFLIQDYFKKWLEQSKRKITFAYYE